MTEERPTIHMIGHGHIDPVWLWRWPEGCAEVRATFRSAIERMHETPAFRFTASSPCLYAWIADTEPALFDAIRDAVDQGRWELAGGWWIEPDCNLPAGESLVRQGLYGQRFLDEHFGRRAIVGFNPDSFGHSGGLPQILAGLGLRYYVFMRPMAGVERNYPEGATFWWEGVDGTRVLACNIQETYNGEAESIERAQRLPSGPWRNRGQRHFLCFYGVGDHGGGPTKRTIGAIKATQAENGGAALAFSTLEQYFQRIVADMERMAVPTCAGGLQHHARGCYSAHAGIKRLIRHTEHALMTAERWAAVGWREGLEDYPAAALERAWKNLLFNQFHDIIAGTSIPSAYEDARDQLGAAKAAAVRITQRTAQTLASQIDTRGEGNAIVVFNPLPWAVSAPVCVTPIAERGLGGPVAFADDEGNAVASAQIASEVVGEQNHIFVASVPGLGYRCYRATTGGTPPHTGRALEVEQHALENDWWRLERDPGTGALARLYDKQNGVEVLAGSAALNVRADGSDTWSHGAAAYRTEAGRFTAARLDPPASGPVLAVLRSTVRYGASVAVHELTLYREIDRIDWEIRVNWQERHCVLKLVLPTAIAGGQAWSEGPYAAEERAANGEEEPMQQWCGLTGHIHGVAYGLAVLNDGQYSFDAHSGALAVTLLRSPAYAHHDPVPCPSDAPVMDQGWHTVRLQPIPHAGPWQDAGIPRRAWEWNAPLWNHIEPAHGGERPGRHSFAAVEGASVLGTVLKRAEDGSALVVRAYESAGRAAACVLRLPGLDDPHHTAFKPYEIKTLRIDAGSASVREVNLLEE